MGTGHGRLILAGVGAFIGGRRAVSKAFSHCAIDHEHHDMGLFAAAAIRRAGESLGGYEGRNEIDRSDARFRAQGVKDPLRFSRIFAPICPFGEETTPPMHGDLARSTAPVR